VAREEEVPGGIELQRAVAKPASDLSEGRSVCVGLASASVSPALSTASTSGVRRGSATLGMIDSIRSSRSAFSLDADARRPWYPCGMRHRGTGGTTQLDAREAGQVEAATLALSRLPVRAPLQDVFGAIRPCVPLAAGFFGIIRPSRPDAMVTCPVGLPPDVYGGWLGTPGDQMAQVLASVVRSRNGSLWRDSETVTSPLREQLDVLRARDAAGLGEGAGYKVLERRSPCHGEEHLLLAILMERGSPIPPRAGTMLAALNPAISAAILRIQLPLAENDSIRAQILAESSTGYIGLSRSGAVLEANRRAHDLVMRYRQAAHVEGGRGAVMDFAARARERSGGGKVWQLEADDPASLLVVQTHDLAKETHLLHEDIVLVAMNEVLLTPSSVEDMFERARLTPREKEIALLLKETPAQSKEIAARLELSPRTVTTNEQRIYAKLGVHSRLELIFKKR
jgi:DNA-binding CsgD family transcriptional regulator